MKAGVIVTGSGSILVLTACGSFDDPEIIDALNEKGIDKFIAFEVPLDLVRNRYGQHYSIAMADRRESDALRVVDVDGQRIFTNLPLDSFGQPLMHEKPAIRRKAA